MFQYTLIVH